MSVFVERMELGSSVLELNESSIVCVVGPNNSGKSSFLHNLAFRVYGNNNYKRNSILSSVSFGSSDFQEAIAEAKKACGEDENGRYFWYNSGGQRASDENFKEFFQKRNQYPHQIRGIFFQYLDTNNRLSALNPAAHIDYDKQPPSHALQEFYKNPDLELVFSDLSKQLFGTEVSIDPGGGGSITLHVGSRVDPEPFGGNRSHGYSREVKKLPRIDSQGDGVRATLGLLAHTIVARSASICVDEPDLYLHPPQAYSLARTLVREKPKRQLFFATHSARFVQALVEEGASRLRLVRLENEDSDYTAHSVDVSVFEEIKDDPILRFTNVVEALFFHRIIVCEDERDCLLYSATLEALGKSKSQSQRQWIGAHGKTNIPKFARVARALGIKAVYVFDFDVLFPKNDSHKHSLGATIRELGGDEQGIVALIEKRLHTPVENTNGVSWDQLKKLGMGALAPYSQIHRDTENILESLRGMGILVLPYGELESLSSPRLEVSKTDYVNEILKKDIVGDVSLENLRSFVKLIDRLST